LHACCIYAQVLQFELFLKQTHAVTNNININNCLTDNSSLDFR
jgi:hypothetical protein